MNLVTDRLLIRSLEAADAASLAKIWSDKAVTHFMGGPRDFEQTYRDLISETAEENADPADALFPVIELTSGLVIGDCGFIKKEVDGKTETEFIYVFAKSEWGKGYATEAARTLCTYAFERLGLHRLIALIDPENKASARVAVKAGLEFWKETLRPTGKRMHVYRREIG